MLTKILRNLPCLFSGQMDQNGEYTYVVLGNTALPGYFFPTPYEKKREREKRKNCGRNLWG